MALSKAGITKRLMDELEWDQRKAKAWVEDSFEEVRTTLEQDEQVKLSGFGNFDLHDKRPRPGRNPKTGEEVLISSRRVVTFRAGGKLTRRVNGQKNKGFVE